MTLGLPLFSWQRLKPTGFIRGLASIADSWRLVQPWNQPEYGYQLNRQQWGYSPWWMWRFEATSIAPRYDGPSSTERRIVRRVKPGPRRAAFHVVVQHLSLCIQLLAMWKTAELNLLILLQVNRLSLHYKFCGRSSTKKIWWLTESHS